MSALLSPFSYQRRAAAEAEPELTIAADDVVSQARIEPATGAIVLPKLVWPENEPWRAPLPSVEPDFLKEVDAEVARAAEANGNGHPPAPVEAAGPAPTPVPPQAAPQAPPETGTPSVSFAPDRTALPRRGAVEPVAPEPEALPQRPPSPFATRVAEALVAAHERPVAAEETAERLPQRSPSPFAAAPADEDVPPLPQRPSSPFAAAPVDRTSRRCRSGLPRRSSRSRTASRPGRRRRCSLRPSPVQSPVDAPAAEPVDESANGSAAEQPSFVPPPFVQPPAAEAARRALFEPTAPVPPGRPVIGEPTQAPPTIITPAPGNTVPVAPTPVPPLAPGDVPPVFPWQLDRTPAARAQPPAAPPGPDQTALLQPDQTALLQPDRPTSLLPPGPVRSGAAPAGNGQASPGDGFRPGPQFVMPTANTGGEQPPGPPDGPFLDLSGMESSEADEHRSRVRRRLAIGAGVALALVVGYGGVAWALSTRIPPDTTIAGVAVGGLNHGAAAAKLRTSLGGRTGPVPVSVAGTGRELDPVQAGLTFDPDETISHSFGFTLAPVDLWHRFMGGLQVAPSARTDRSKLTAAMTELAAQTRVDPKDGTVDFGSGRATLREPVPGRSLDVIAAVDLVDKHWLGAAAPIELPVTEQEPTTSRQEAQDALDRIGTPALSGPLAVTVGPDRVSLTPEQFAGSLSMRANEVGALSLVVNGPKLRSTVLAAKPELEHDAADAKIVVAGGKPKLIPAVDGITIAPDELATAAARALTGTDRTAVLNPAPKPAAFTTAMAQALGIKERTSSASTPLSGSAGRITNLRVATRTLNGMIVKPGETFSLNGALGERTAEKGYKEAIIISEGAYEKGLGGGVSNVATLTFNNVFFSGLKDITHKPHSFYISHYPVGREATVHWDDVDLKWQNDSPYGVLITAGVDSGKVHMEFWSTKVWDVKAITGPRTNFRAPKVIFSTKPLCVPQNPSSGFDINVTRVFSKGGQEVKRQVFKTSYIATDDITCGEKPTPTVTPSPTPGVGPGED